MKKTSLGGIALLTSAVILSGCSDDFKEQAQVKLDSAGNFVGEKLDQVMDKVNEKVDQVIDSAVDSIQETISNAAKTKIDEWLGQNQPTTSAETDADYQALIEANADLQALIESLETPESTETQTGDTATN